MIHPNLSPAPNIPDFSRRSVLAAIPAVAVLSACSGPAPGGLGEDAFAAGDGSQGAIDHSRWDAILKAFVVEGENGVNLVRYQALADDARGELTAYLEAMQATPIEEFDRDEQFAFWVNLYNAVTVDVILENLPVGSIRDIGLLGLGPWKDEAVTVSGRVLSLDDIEHNILRPEWRDVRIHYAVNCASIGCPNLAREAYTAAKMETMLDAAATAYVNHPRGFSGSADNVIASSIYDWYQDDWGSAGEVLEHARQYAKGPTKALLNGASSIAGYDYDWSLNAA